MTAMEPTTHTTHLDDGRQITTDVAGPDDGPTVVLLHAAPGSRRFDPDPAVTESSGTRLVTVDRPGYGGSTSLPEGVVPTVPGFADDMVAALTDLGIGDATLVGWSAGGRIAAAVAASHPELVSRLVIVATPAPDTDVPWVPDEQRGAIDMMRSDPAAAVAQMSEMLATMTADPAAAVGMVSGGDADEAMLAADPRLRARVEAMVAEGVAAGPVGLAADIISYTVVDWGFDPAAIGAPTTCVYGADDPTVTPAHGRWWASRIPAADLQVVDGVGHLVIATAWRDLIT